MLGLGREDERVSKSWLDPRWGLPPPEEGQAEQVDEASEDDELIEQRVLIPDLVKVRVRRRRRVRVRVRVRVWVRVKVPALLAAAVAAVGVVVVVLVARKSSAAIAWRAHPQGETTVGSATAGRHQRRAMASHPHPRGESPPLGAGKGGPERVWGWP